MPRTRRSSLELLAQPRALRGELIEQHPPHRARADDAHRDGVRRQVQPGVHRAQRAHGTAAVDHRGDVALGCALGDGAHVDPRHAERGEQLRRHARRAGHAVADHREDRQVGIDVDALDLAAFELALEGAAHDGGRLLRLLLRDRAADRVLGAALRDQDDGDALLAQRAEQAVRGARHADHAGALEVHQRHALDAGDALDGQREVGWAQMSVPAFSGAKVLRIQMGMRVLHRRRHGLRVDDLGAEVRQLHRLVVGQRIDDGGVGHAARIGGHHAIDVGPDLNLGGVRAAHRRSRRRNRCRCGRAWSALRARSAAMKPVMTSVPWQSAGTASRNRARDSAHWMPGPSGPHSDHDHAPRIEPVSPARGAARARRRSAGTGLSTRSRRSRRPGR